MKDRFWTMSNRCMWRGIVWVCALNVALILSVSRADASEPGLSIIPYRLLHIITGGMELPSDVAVDGTGRVFVLDGTNNIIRIFDNRGTFRGTLGSDAVLNQPLGIDVSPEGDVLVADSGNNRLVLFPKSADNPQILRLPQPAAGKPCNPTDALFSPTGKVLYAVDNDNHQIIAIDRKGRLQWKTGSMGRNPGEFRFPFLVDGDSLGNIYIAEVINTRIQVLTPEGDFNRFIGGWGIEPGQFYRPKGIAVNIQDKVFVTDSYVGVVHVFDRYGEFLGAVGDVENGLLRKFETPTGITATDNRLYVVEMFNNRVLVLESRNESNSGS